MKSLFRLLILCLLGRATAFSQGVPEQMNYQGQLSNSDGTRIADGYFDMKFRIYGSPSGSTDPIWGPQNFTTTTGGRVYVTNGLFNVPLGPSDHENPPRRLATAFTGATRYLEIKVGGKPIFPRQQILSAPFAFHSGDGWRRGVDSHVVLECLYPSR